MKKCLLIVSLFSWQLKVLSQYTEFRRLDSLKVDSLRKSLAGLNGQEKVDVLNRLSVQFASFSAIGGFTNRADSMYRYALEANKEATELDYKYGLVNSLLNLSSALKYARRFDHATDPAEKKYLLQAIKMGEQIHNDSILGSGYYLLAGHEEGEANYKKAIFHFQKAGDLQNETEVTTWLCMSYSNKGQYEEGFPYCDKCLQLARKNVASSKNDWTHELVQWSLYDMAELYKAAGDYETTLDYYRQLNQYAEENHLSWITPIDKIKAELFLLTGQFDSASYYWKNWEKNQPDNWEPPSPGARANDNTSLGLIYLKTGQPDKALPLFTESINTFYEMGKKMSGYSMIKPLLYKSEVYVLKNDFVKALTYTKEAYALSQEDNRRPSIMDSYEMFSRIYHHLGKNDSAYLYSMKYTKLKDSIFNKQFLWRLNNYKKAAEEQKKTSQINLLNKDNQLKEQKLKQEATIKNSLIAVLILLLPLGIFIFRTLNLKRKSALEKQRLENEKKQAELQQRATELEMQALRSQMNPHFIFNCLSSINKFILKNDTDAASDYLTRFSRLIRLVLTNSQLSLIPLSDEIEMLRLYLDMERLRFSEAFNYNIIYGNAIEPEMIYIPPMLLQPFCENAIWHGLMHKEGQGILDVNMSIQDGALQCIIADNGIGREKAAELKSKSGTNQKSFGLKITTERLALFNNEKTVHSFYNTEDVMDDKGNVAGTRVILKIGYKDSVEETTLRSLRSPL